MPDRTTISAAPSASSRSMRHAPDRILGFYTLQSGEFSTMRARRKLCEGLGRYEVPVFRLGRSGVDLKFRGKDLVGKLLLAAGERALWCRNRSAALRF